MAGKFSTAQLLARMTPLDMRGVFAAEPLPDGFDLDTDERLELAVHGLHWMLDLASSDDPGVRALLADVRASLPSARLVEPRFTVRPDRTNAGGPARNSNWSGGAVSCPSTPFTMPPTSPLDAYTTPGQQHVHYIGSDSHIRELFYDGYGWHTVDLSKDADALAFLPIGAMAGLATADPDVQHVLYVGPDALIHQLFWDGSSWRHDSPGRDAGAPAVRAGGAIAAYASGEPDQQHVIYLDDDGQIQELVYDGSWHPNDLSHVSGADVSPHSWSELVGLASPWDGGQQHVFYLGDDSHVHELVYAGQWKPHDLTKDSGALRPAAAHSPLHAYLSEDPDQVHVVYLDDLGRVHELMYDGTWHDNDLTGPSGAPTARPDSPLRGFTTTGQQHVVYVDTNSAVQQLLYDGSRWTPEDLTASGRGLVVAAGSRLTGYATGDPDQQHVEYVGTDLHLHELVYTSGGWTDNDLTPLNFAPFQTAVGRWTVPSVSEPDYPEAAGTSGWSSSTWVGIDGWGGATQVTNDVLQAGTAQSIDVENTEFVAWYEWFTSVDEDTPDYIHQVDIDSMPVNPGDSMLCVVSALDATTGSFFLQNETSGDYLTLTLTAPQGASFAGASAEWIMEAPQFSGAQSRLPAFTPVVFTSAFATDSTSATTDAVTSTIQQVVLGDPTTPWTPVVTGVTLAPGQVTITYLPWRDTDLTVASGLAAVAPVAGPVCGYVSTDPDQLHFDFVGADGDVHEMFSDGTTWTPTDLTTSALAPVAPAAGSALVGYTTDMPAQQHVVYVGTDGHVHELMYDGSWHPTDLSSAGGASAGALTGRLVGYTSTDPRQQHLFYVGTDLDVHELAYDGANWTDRRLTDLVGRPGSVAAGSGLAGYATPGQLHVHYATPDGSIHELVYGGGNWTPHDLPTPASAAPNSDMVGFTSPAPTQQHVCYIGTDGHVHELAYDGGWTPHDLTVDSGAPIDVAPGSALVGYRLLGPAQLHVDYVGTDGHVWELLYDGSWHANDLTVASGGVTVTPGSLCGLPADRDSRQYLGVIGTDGHLHELEF